ncbi:MAG: nitrilase-related carbon-nitrogen hydrolase, partial [Rubrivivax sp.]
TLELERPMLRSTNTGVTAIIDHDGRVLAQLPAFTRATLEGEVDGRTGLTPYAAWAGRWGLLPLWLAGLLMAGCGLLAGRRS